MKSHYSPFFPILIVKHLLAEVTKVWPTLPTFSPDKQPDTFVKAASISSRRRQGAASAMVMLDGQRLEIGEEIDIKNRAGPRL